MSELSELWKRFDELRAHRERLRGELVETQSEIDEVGPKLRAAITDCIPRIDALTEGDRKYLSLIRQGMQNKEIAARLNVSVSTVKWHDERLLRKMAVSSRHDL